MSSVELKNTMRKFLLEKRSAINPDDINAWSERICQRLLDILEFDQLGEIQKVFAYAAFRNEPDLSDLLKHLLGRQTCALPAIDASAQAMEFYPWQWGEALVQNKFGIAEPAAKVKSVEPNEQTVILVPAVAYDMSGFRLGYGKGYYDRYLFQHPGVKTIGVCFESLIQKNLPREKHDIAVQWVVTDRDIYQI